MTKVLDIREFNMRFLPGSVILLLGARGTGKSTLARACLFFMTKYEMGIIMAGTPDTIEEYAQHHVHTLIYEKYQPQPIIKMIRLQKRKLYEICEKYPHETVERNCLRLPPMFLVLDDVMHDHNMINKSLAFNELMFYGRHYRITLIVAAQYVMQVAKRMRGQIDYVFTTYQQDPFQRENIMKQYNVGFPDTRTFHKIMEKCTENYQAMVMAMHSTKRHLEERVFYYKAIRGRRFRVGPRSLWKAHRRRFNKRYHLDDNDEKKPHYVVRTVPRKRQRMF